jgi:hypothetical protein
MSEKQVRQAVYCSDGELRGFAEHTVDVVESPIAPKDKPQLGHRVVWAHQLGHGEPNRELYEAIRGLYDNDQLTEAVALATVVFNGRGRID